MKCFLCLLFPFLSASLHAQTSYPPNSYREISLPQLLDKKQKGDTNLVIIDVRTAGEFHDTLSQGKQLNIGRIKGAIHVELQSLRDKQQSIQQLNSYRDKDIYLICSHSYRSRSASNILLANGFKNVTNVRGGMTEWYRNYDELLKFALLYHERFIDYKIISAAELYNTLSRQNNITFFGFTGSPKVWQDSLAVKFYEHFPDFRNVTYFRYADSLQVLEKAQAEKGKQIVTFNTTGMGGAEMAQWLTKKGIQNVSYLVENLNGFYEYMVNFRQTKMPVSFLEDNSEVHFLTAASLCAELQAKKNIQLVDIRHDTLFNKVTNGVKLNFKHLQGAINFPATKTANEFISQFPDKKKEYVFIQRGLIGFDLADDLIQRGYRIAWLIGGNDRWEWYTNNITNFACTNYFVQ